MVGAFPGMADDFENEKLLGSLLEQGINMNRALLLRVMEHVREIYGAYSAFCTPANHPLWR